MKGCKIYGIIDGINAKKIQIAGVRDVDSDPGSSCGSSGGSSSNFKEVKVIKDVNRDDFAFNSSSAFLVTGGSRRIS